MDPEVIFGIGTVDEGAICEMKESHGQCDDHHPKLLYDDPLPLKPAKVAYLKKKARSTFVSKFLHESLR